MVMEEHESDSEESQNPIPRSQVISLKFGIDGKLILVIVLQKF